MLSKRFESTEVDRRNCILPAKDKERHLHLTVWLDTPPPSFNSLKAMQ